MKLTNKHIADLTRARKLIADGDHDYICWALRYVGADVKLWRRIESLLKPNDTVHDWLLFQRNIHAGLLTDENLRAYRLRWIDHMIATRTL
jgi:hypothetical protein